MENSIVKLGSYDDKCARLPWRTSYKTAINRLYYINGGQAWYTDAKGRHPLRQSM